MTKTIVIATGIYAPEIGGPATFLAQIIPELKAMGHTVRVVTYGDPRPDCITVSRKSNLLFRMYRFYRAVLNASKDADVIFATDIFSAGYPAYRAAQKLKKRFIVRFVGDVVWETMRSQSKTTVPFDAFQRTSVSPLYECARRMQRIVISGANEVLTVSHQLGTLAKNWGSKNVTIVANSVEAYKKSNKAAIRKKWNIPTKEFVIASIGRLTNYKRVDDIIKATQAPWRLIIAGDGPEMSRLKEIASTYPSTITFLGSVDSGRVRELLSLCDVLVVASEYEGMSHTILEALVEKKIVVASDVDGNTELLSDGHSGFLYSLGDVDMLRQILTKIADGSYKIKAAAWKPISHVDWLQKNSEVITR